MGVGHPLRHQRRRESDAEDRVSRATLDPCVAANGTASFCREGVDTTWVSCSPIIASPQLSLHGRQCFGLAVLWPALRPEEEGLQGSAVVLFTRDLRVHDNPALAAAVERFERVLPLFVLDGGLLSSFGAPNRVAFLLDSLQALRGSLRARGGELALRRGDVVEETVRVARDVQADCVFLSDDVSGYAQEREERLRRGLAGERIELETFPGVTVVPPGELAPAGFEAFRVFTPYWRRWRLEPRRPVLPAPERIVLPTGVVAGKGAGTARARTRRARTGVAAGRRGGRPGASRALA